MKKVTVLLFLALFMVTFADAVTVPTPRHLWWMNDSLGTGAFSNQIRDYGLLNHTLVNMSTGANLITTDCHANYTQCANSTATTSRWDTNQQSFPAYQNITIATFLKHVSAIGASNQLDGQSAFKVQGGASGLTTELAFRPNATQVKTATQTYELNQWYVHWVTHFENATGWFACTSINQSVNEKCVQTNGNLSTTPLGEWQYYGFNSITEAEIIWQNVTLNSTDRECIYSKLLAGNRTFTCEESSGSSGVSDTTAPSLNFTIISVTNNSGYVRIGGNESYNFTLYYNDASTKTFYYNSTNITGDRYYNITSTSDGLDIINNTKYDVTPMVCDQSNNCANLTYTENFTTSNNTWTVSALAENYVVLNITFDLQSNVSKDTAMSHNFTLNNANVTWLNSSYCKINGCVNFSTYANDYIYTYSKFSYENGISVCFWVYLLDDLFDSITHYYFSSGTGKDDKALDEAQYGLRTRLDLDNGTVSTIPGEGYNPPTETWTHYCMVYNESSGTKSWKNGVLIDTDTTVGNLNYTVGEIIRIGAGIQGGTYTMRGYMDEFLLWNSTINFSTVTSIYESQKYGTLPNKEIYVKAIKYDLPINWSTVNNTLNPYGTMEINITIANSGVNSSGFFNTNLTVGAFKCGSRNNLSSQAEYTLVCNWTKSYGFHIGNVTLDIANEVSEFDETNNNQKVYIPFMDRPWFHFNLTEWGNELKPYCDNSSNSVAYAACQMADSFASENFDTGWSGNDVDPRGKKGRENAMGCMYNGYTNYDASHPQCDNAHNHLYGWGNRTISTYSSVQSIHELAHVGITFDIMMPNMTQEEYELIAHQYHDICQHITQLTNTQPYNDNEDEIAGDNGFGFGSGMGGFCYAIIGAYKENPTLIVNHTDQYWGENIPDSWMQREDRYLMAYKNDSYAQYQEGWLYKTYSQPHIVENTYFRKKYGLFQGYDFNNAFCAMARESTNMILDANYKGSVFRGDEARYIRAISRGDTNSYQHISDSQFINWDIALFYGILCDDIDVKGSMLWLREFAKNTTDGTAVYPAMYLAKQIDQSADMKKPEYVNPKFSYDNANDIVIVRTNFTYVNDTILQIDGGEERGGGHSQAQGYFLYVLGEPFIDYEQVPYEDDVRDETWKNGISLQNTTLVREGTVGHYNDVLGVSELNQYYGGSETKYYSTDYPNFRSFPISYGGDIEDYIGTSDVNFAGAYVYRPYTNSNPVQEYFIKFGDTIAKRSIVTGNTQGDKIYHNFIGIANEFTSINSGLNWTLNRTNNATKQNIYLNTQLIYSDSNIAFDGGTTNVSYCFAKTSCTYSANRLYRRNYYYTDVGDTALDLIFSHKWNVGSATGITAINSTEKGLQDGNNYIYFDGDNSGTIYTSSAQTDGWGMVYNTVTDEYGCFNCTQLNTSIYTIISSNATSRFHIKKDDTNNKYYLTANSYDRLTYIDEDVPITVTVNVQDMAVSATVNVTKNGVNIPASQVGNDVTFEVSTSQNSDEYLLTGSGTDLTAPVVVTISNTTTNTTAFITITALENFNLSLVYGNSATNLTQATVTNTTVQNPNTITITGLAVNYTYYYNVTLCDVSGNCGRNGTYYFKTLENSIDLTAPKIDTLETSLITTSSFSITAVLNESGNMTLWYGETTTFNESTYQTYAENHVFALSGLTNNTMYYYLLNGSDIYGNYYTSVIYNQTTSQTASGVPSATTSGCSTAMANTVTAIETIVTFLSLIITVVMLGFIVGLITGWINLEAIQANEQSAMALYVFVGGLVFVGIIIATGIVIISTFGGAC